MVGKISLDGYRVQWPRVGGVLAMALGGVVTLTARLMSRPQLLSAVNLGALFVHQYEEYADPGWFPGQFNRGVLKSDQPRNIRALNAEEGLTRGDIIKGAAYTVGFAVVAIGGPNIIGSDKNSPYAFTPAQMGPHDVPVVLTP